MAPEGEGSEHGNDGGTRDAEGTLERPEGGGSDGEVKVAGDEGERWLWHGTVTWRTRERWGSDEMDLERDMTCTGGRESSPARRSGMVSARLVLGKGISEVALLRVWRRKHGIERVEVSTMEVTVWPEEHLRRWKSLR